MLDLKDCKISLAINGVEIDTFIQILTFKISESIHHLVPFGTLVFTDQVDVFHQIQLVGGEILSLTETNSVTEVTIVTDFKIIFVQMVKDKTYVINFVLYKPKLLEEKRCVSYKSMRPSSIIKKIMSRLGIKDLQCDISQSLPQKNWVQPYVTDGQFINYLSERCYFTGRFNFYSWFGFDGVFHFKSYEEIAFESQISDRFTVSDPIIYNDRFFNTMKKFNKRLYFFDITTNSFSKLDFKTLPQAESKYTIQPESDENIISDVLGISSTNNASAYDYQFLGYKSDESFIMLEYKMSGLISPLELAKKVTLTVMSKAMGGTTTETKTNTYYSGVWIVGEIQKEYSKDGAFKTITFIKKGLDNGLDRVKSKNAFSSSLGNGLGSRLLG